ncbi:Shikimate kinase [Bertholletia excelsa]
MEARCGKSLHLLPPWTVSDKVEGRLSVFLRVSQRCRSGYGLGEFCGRNEATQRGRISLTVSHACKDRQAPSLQSGNFRAPFDGSFCKNKGKEVASYLNGRCVFLVGMMGSGKTTVGKVLSEALAYSFVDSDQYVEEALGGKSVEEIFKQFGESFFRDCESEALRNLSLVPQQVVATGGGAVVRPINWKYMSEGITVHLDAPLDSLARRIAAVGTDSRPLLDFGSEDAYTKAFTSLFVISKKRQQAYENADTIVSFTNVATKQGLDDMSEIAPTTIALEVLGKIENFLQSSMSAGKCP